MNNVHSLVSGPPFQQLAGERACSGRLLSCRTSQARFLDTLRHGGPLDKWNRHVYSDTLPLSSPLGSTECKWELCLGSLFFPWSSGIGRWREWACNLAWVQSWDELTLSGHTTLPHGLSHHNACRDVLLYPFPPPGMWHAVKSRAWSSPFVAPDVRVPVHQPLHVA